MEKGEEREVQKKRFDLFESPNMDEYEIWEKVWVRICFHSLQRNCG